MSRNPPKRSYRSLPVWQKAQRFAQLVNATTHLFPGEETRGLTLQFRQAADSVAANVAEAHGERERAHRARMLRAAEDSAQECAYYSLLAADLEYCEPTGLLLQLNKLGRLLRSYAASALSAAC